MKRFIFLFITGVILCVLPARAQSAGPEGLHPAFVRAFQTGEVTSLTPILSMQVELHLPEQEGIYNRTQATVILKNFLESHQIRSFSLLHQGMGGPDASYFIGIAQGEEPYRVYVFQKNTPDGPIIQEIRIDYQ